MRVATKLAIDAALSGVVAGAPITLRVELTDNAGATVDNALGTVTVAIAAGIGAVRRAFWSTWALRDSQEAAR